jgi:hypothetical protein
MLTSTVISLLVEYRGDPMANFVSAFIFAALKGRPVELFVLGIANILTLYILAQLCLPVHTRLQQFQRY